MKAVIEDEKLNEKTLNNVVVGNSLLSYETRWACS
jgi:hypothetical protein